MFSIAGFSQNPPFIEKDFTIRVKLKPGQVISALSNFTEDLTPHDNTENTYYQSYFNAQNPELLKFYTLSGQGNQDSMVTYLTSTELFDAIIGGGYVYPNGCANPLPAINDSLFAQGLLSDYHLNLIDANCAWSITTGDTNVIIGIADTDFHWLHEDLVGKVDNIGGVLSNGHEHGTGVAGCAAAKTNNGKGIAAIGYNCRLALQRIFHAPSGGTDSILVGDAIWDLYQQGVPVINASWTKTGLDYLIVQEMIDNGTTLILPAGNSPNSIQHTDIANIPGVINVSGVNQNNEHGPTNHAHNQYVDLCAPSVDISVLRAGAPSSSALGGFGPSRYDVVAGTSYAAPMVAGTVGLMLSVNPCLSPASIEAILKSTTDPITDATSYPGIIGAGRLNAYEAVKAAQAVYSTNLDLSIKDRVEDYGVSGGYAANLPRANSPDIWVRNQPDGLTNQTHQNPEFTIGQPVYIYVRVRNESCADLIGGTEQLSLYWSKASSWSSWPQNWNGSYPNTGDLIGSQSFLSLPGGNEKILQFTWNILNPYVHENWATCLLARIENSTQDPITVYPSRLDKDVYYNNNIAQKNLTIVDFIDPPSSGYPHGKFMYIGNPTDQDQTYDFKFTVPVGINGQPITDVAEIKIIFDAAGWDIIGNYITPNESIEIDAENRTITSESESFQITAAPFSSKTRVPIYVGFSFLTDEIGEKKEFNYQVIQYLAADNSLLGSEHFIIVRPNRDGFDADAGNDKSIKKNETVTVSATDISETATYNWYDETGNLVYTGKDLSVSPLMTEKYKLEVIAGVDGFKDYDEVIVEVKDCYINTISPNPASNNVVVDYKTENITSGYIMVLNATATTNNNYIINVNQTQASFNVANYQQGTYSVILVCDGVAVDMKTLIVQ